NNLGIMEWDAGNIVGAKNYFTKSCENKNTNACENLNELESEINQNKEEKVEYISIYDKMQNGGCIDSRNFGYVIVEKIDNKNYLLRSDASFNHKNAILKTKEAIYEQTGLPVGINIKKVG